MRAVSATLTALADPARTAPETVTDHIQEHLDMAGYNSGTAIPDPTTREASAMPMTPIRLAEQPFTNQDPAHWAGSLGPAWITPGEEFPGGFLLDVDVAPAITSFVASALALADPHGDIYDMGTVYATRFPIGCTAGNLHFDGGRFDPRRQVTRVISAWTSDGTPAQNVFADEPDPVIDIYLQGEPTPNPALFRRFVQFPNRYAVAFDEGIHLHGRAALADRPGAYGYFISSTLYRPGQAVDLHCPRLAALRPRGRGRVLDNQVERIRAVY
jgi:hypothetical protein